MSMHEVTPYTIQNTDVKRAKLKDYNIIYQKQFGSNNQKMVVSHSFICTLSEFLCSQ
jgi:hypothetical protein